MPDGDMRARQRGQQLQHRHHQEQRDHRRTGATDVQGDHHRTGQEGGGEHAQNGESANGGARAARFDRGLHAQLRIDAQGEEYEQ